MIKKNMVDYDAKNIEDYKNLAVLLHHYHSGEPMRQEYLDMIAQAKPEHRMLAMNCAEKQKIGLTSEFGVGVDNETYLLGEALIIFYYGDKSQLTHEQLYRVALATDEEKAWALECCKGMNKFHTQESNGKSL